jgi:hypothetical protein
MAYEKYYEIFFDDVNEIPFRVEIWRQGLPISPTIKLIPSASPFVLNYKKSSDILFAPFMLSEATISFYNTADGFFKVSNLADSDDFQWLIKLIQISSGKTLWRGFLDVNSCVDELQDYPSIVKLRATDGIGLLDSIPFSQAGAEVYSKVKLINAIGDCLNFMPDPLPLLIECNMFEMSHFDRADNPTYDPFFQTLVYGRSFMKDVTTYESCHKVLELILQSFNCTLFQAMGEWHIMRYPDRWMNDNNGKFGSIYAPAYVGTSPIGARQMSYDLHITSAPPSGFLTFLVNADATREYIKAAKCGIANYKIQTPEAIPRNITFQQGTLDPAIPYPPYKMYTIDYWSYMKYNFGSLVPCVAVPHFLEVYDTVTEKLIDAYAQLPQETAGILDPMERLVSQFVEVTKGNVLEISFDTRTAYDIPLSPVAAGSRVVAEVRFFGISGTQYTLNQLEGNWVVTPANTAGEFFIVEWTIDNPFTKEWRTVEGKKSEGFPEDGNIYLSLIEWSSNNAIGAPNNSKFKNLVFNISPYVNGFDGLELVYGRMCQNPQLRENVEIDSFLGDAQAKTLTGAMFRASNDTQLTVHWNQFGITEAVPHVQILARDLFRARRRVRTIVEGTLLYCTITDPRNPFSTDRVLASPCNHVTMTAIPSKTFLFRDMGIDVQAGTMRFSMMEHWDGSLDDAAEDGDSWVYKYTFNT